MASDEKGGEDIIMRGESIIKEIDNVLNTGTILDLGKIFLGKRDKRTAENLRAPIVQFGTNTIYNHWTSWRADAERFILKKWGYSKNYRSFKEGNSTLNRLFYDGRASLGQIKASFSEQMTEFRTLLSTDPPPWWRRIPSVLVEEFLVLMLKIIGRSI